MVSVINPGKSLRNALQYNENKLRQGKATLIHSGGFGKDTHELSFSDKLGHLLKTAARRESVEVNSVHISLNFHPSEKLSKQSLQQIAESYLQKIGFEGQPFLVYEHHDAGHPHLHIVTTNIRPNGGAINLHNIGRNQSEQARKSIEKEFSLVPADRRQRQAIFNLKPVNAEKVQYGRSETKRAITNVLDHVLSRYKYSSLAELNAVLRSYNVTADQGAKDSRIARNNGLAYRVLNEQGERVGVPIKASDFYNKPTLKFLQEKFDKNETQKEKYKQRVKNAVDLAFARNSNTSIKGLTEALRKQNIQLVVRENKDGIIYGVTFVDHDKKVVFNGSALGKSYSASQIVERTRQIQGQVFQPSQQQTPTRKTQQQSPPPSPLPLHTTIAPPRKVVPQSLTATQPNTPALPPDQLAITAEPSGLLKEILYDLTAHHGGSGPAAELKYDKKKKRKRKPKL